MIGKPVLKRRVSAFSLLEMALVLSIIGIVSAYAIPALIHMRTAARMRETDAKLEAAIYALAGFVQREEHLPPPAPPTAIGENAGHAQKGLTTGILPYRTLGIQESDAKDGFRHWISYSVSPELTISRSQNADYQTTQKKAAPTTGPYPKNMNQMNMGNMSPVSEDRAYFCWIRPTPAQLQVRNVHGQSVFDLYKQDLIAFVLVSHGPSGAGAFDDTGQRRASTGDKLKNLGNTPFIDQPNTKEYDDRVRWVSRNNLMAMYLKQPCKP